VLIKNVWQNVRHTFERETSECQNSQKDTRLAMTFNVSTIIDGFENRDIPAVRERSSLFE